MFIAVRAAEERTRGRGRLLFVEEQCQNRAGRRPWGGGRCVRPSAGLGQRAGPLGARWTGREVQTGVRLGAGGLQEIS